ncbi:MAG: hypothetical protein WEE64_00570 [Dehalococcoidia bacterium]
MTTDSQGDTGGTGASSRQDDSPNWAQPVEKLVVSPDMPRDAVNINVSGRRLTSPLQGFGKMWQKTYRIRLSGSSATPAQVIQTWKSNFASFWPKGNRFYAPITGVAPGEVAVLNLSQGPLKLSTGVMVLYADDESFTLMTPQGHMFAGWITFSAFEEDASSVAQTQVLVRTGDPLYEIGMSLGGYAKEDQFWQDTLRALARHFEVESEPTMQITCVDPRRQWSQAKNVWHNAAIRSALYTMAAPARWVAAPFRRGR